MRKFLFALLLLATTAQAKAPVIWDSSCSIGIRNLFDGNCLSPGMSTTWGDITGVLSDQTDLQSALDAKQDALTFSSPLVNTADTISITRGNITGTGITVTGGTNAAVGGAVAVSLPQTHDLWVDRNGSDAAGCGQLTNACQTVGYAFGLVTSPSSTNNWTVHLMSGRHDQETNDVLIPPYTWLVGSGGPDVGSYLRFPSGKALKLASGWTVNARGGVQSIYFGGGSSINLDFAAAGGSAGSNFMLDDVFVTGSFTHTGRGVNGGDFLYIQNSFMFGNASMTGSELQSVNSTWGGTVTMTTSSTVTSDATFIGGSVGGAFSFTETNALTASLSMTGTSFLGGFTTVGTLAMSADQYPFSGVAAISAGTTITPVSFLYQTVVGSQPACSSANRGLEWLVQGGAGVADVFQVCQKSVADTYLWVTH